MRPKDCADGVAVEVLIKDKWRPAVIEHSAGYGKAGPMFMLRCTDDGATVFAYPIEMRLANLLDRFVREV